MTRRVCCLSFSTAQSHCLHDMIAWRLHGRWIYKKLLPPVDSVAEEEPDSDRASALRQAQPLETQLLLTGRREIDGPMDSGSGLYPQDYLVEDVHDLSRGQRCAGAHD